MNSANNETGDIKSPSSNTKTKKKNTLYDVLGLDSDCTQEEIKRAYRKLALRYHPDKNPGDSEAEAKFKEINHAHTILSDVDKKRIYDAYGDFGLKSAEQMGEEQFNTLFVNNKYGKCIAVLALFLFCSTCCCFGCFCCCCCFNFCCRRCAPQPQFDPDTNNNTNNEYHDNEVL